MRRWTGQLSTASVNRQTRKPTAGATRPERPRLIQPNTQPIAPPLRRAPKPASAQSPPPGPVLVAAPSPSRSVRRRTSDVRQSRGRPLVGSGRAARLILSVSVCGELTDERPCHGPTEPAKAGFSPVSWAARGGRAGPAGRGRAAGTAGSSRSASRAGSARSPSCGMPCRRWVRRTTAPPRSSIAAASP